MSLRVNQVSRREVLAGLGSLAAPGIGCGGERCIDLAAFGAFGDGHRDSADAFRRALRELARVGGTLMVPAGRFLITDKTAAAGAGALRLPPGTTLAGTGGASVLIFQRQAGQAFYGLTIDSSGISIRDIVMEVDTGGHGWTAAVAITGAAARLRFDRVEFRGTGTRTGHTGVLPINADLDGLTMERCSFRRLDFGFTRATTDTSDYRNLQFIDCIGDDCTEVLELNAPGLSNGPTRRGSPVIPFLTDEFNKAAIVPSFRIGQIIRSAAFPRGTKVVKIDDQGLHLSQPAIATMSTDKPARISAGSCTGGTIRNLRCSNIGQWAIGMAHCEDWDVSAEGRDIQYELVHLEDGCRDIRVVAGGIRCNLRPGVLGSPKADNGMVHISTGCSNVSVRFDIADLTQNEGHLVNALCAQPGIMGTTGVNGRTSGISVSGRVLLKANTRAVTAYETDLQFDDFEMRNVNPASRASPMLRLPGCSVSGNLAVLNPGTVVEAGYGASVSFSQIQTLDR